MLNIVSCDRGVVRRTPFTRGCDLFLVTTSFYLFHINTHYLFRKVKAQITKTTNLFIIKEKRI
ncbi:hypothetical protein B1P95_17545 [Enterococcus faecium]|uniref:Uncharacterized protein n=1 Tax=Enterococcus faecium TaxID=1352 RepID=A0A1S8KCU2_ENTFC|nr:hypothetical protein B1P95_17545 [Enterococcus faecium]